MDEMLRQVLGDAARAARPQLGLQAEVAKEVGLRMAAHGRIERGGMTPSIPTLRRMYTTLGLSADPLLLCCWRRPTVISPVELFNLGSG